LIQGDNQNWEDDILTENESVHNPVILNRSTIVYENNYVQHTRPTEQEVMIDKYTIASSAADSLKFKNIIINKSSSNTTEKLILKMISQNDFKDIYYEQILLVLQFFGDQLKYLVGGLKCIDMTDTAASTASKLMADMP